MSPTGVAPTAATPAVRRVQLLSEPGGERLRAVVYKWRNRPALLKTGQLKPAERTEPNCLAMVCIGSRSTSTRSCPLVLPLLRHERTRGPAELSGIRRHPWLNA